MPVFQRAKPAGDERNARLTHVPDILLTSTWQIALGLAHLTALIGLAGWGLATVGLCLRRGPTSLSRAESVALVLIWGLAILSVTSLLLADAGRFALVWLDVVAAVCALAGLAARAARRAPPDPAPQKRAGYTGWLIPLLCAAAVLFARPFEYMKGGWDPGIYTSIGASIARSGSLTVRDGLLPELPDEDRVVMYHRRHRRPQLYPGFLVADADKGLLKPSYYHLFSAWTAVLFSLFGLPGIFWASCLPALGALFLLCLYVHRAFSAPAAWLAGLFLLLCPAQIYFARYQTTEMLTQFFLLGAFWSLCWSQQDGGKPCVFGEVTAAACFAVALLIHSTSVLPALCLLGVWPAFAPRRTTADALRFPALLVAFLALAFLRNWTQSHVVTVWLARVFMRRQSGFQLFAAALAVMAGITLYLMVRSRGMIRLTPAARSALGKTAAAIVLAALCAGYFIRPHVTSGNEALNVRLLGWLVSPAALLLAAAFFVLHRPDRWTFAQTVFIVPAGVTSAVFLVDKMMQPVLIYAARRYVSLVVPLAVTLAAAAAVLLFRKWRGMVPRILAGALCAAAIGYEVYQSVPVLRVREEHGLAAFYREVAARLDNADLVICDHQNDASPLRFIFGLPAYAMGRQNQESGVEYAQRRIEYLRAWARAGKRVFYVADGGFFFDPAIRLDEVGRVTGTVRRLRQHTDRLPRDIVAGRQNAVIYEITARDAGPVPEPPEQTLAMGYHAFGLVSGFHRAQRSGDISYRWTDGLGELYIPCYGRAAATGIVLHMAAKRARTDTPVTAEILVDGRPLETLAVSQDWADHRVTIPAKFWRRTVPPPVIRLGIRSEVWDPAVDGLAGYPTNLGVRLASVRVARGASGK
ncbi:MAG: hypothetical protein JXB04_02105 [Kiritimatiellae bacterium]|nr:hypothetical protein [Kiritimatiellia bacterium]